MPAYNWGQAKDVVNTRYRFDPLAGTVLESALLALLFDGKHVRDYFSDLYTVWPSSLSV